MDSGSPSEQIFKPEIKWQMKRAAKSFDVRNRGEDKSEKQDKTAKGKDGGEKLGANRGYSFLSKNVGRCEQYKENKEQNAIKKKTKSRGYTARAEILSRLWVGQWWGRGEKKEETDPGQKVSGGTGDHPK